jgi:hypothetical protein
MNAILDNKALTDTNDIKQFNSSNNSSISDEIISFVKKNIPTLCDENLESFNNPKINNEIIKSLILNSNINFYAANWSKKLSKTLNITEEKSFIWLKNNLPQLFKKARIFSKIKKVSCPDDYTVDFYKEDLFKIYSNVSNATFIKNLKRKEAVLNSNIDFKKIGWKTEVAKLLELSPASANNWIDKYMPELVKNSYPNKVNKKEVAKKEPASRGRKPTLKKCVDINLNNKVTTDRQRIKIINSLNSEFIKKKGWSGTLSKMINIPLTQLFTWLNENVPDFYDNIYKDDIETINTNNMSKRFDVINEERKKIIDSCNIDFGKGNWDSELSKLFGISDMATRNWLEKNMPEFYSNILSLQKKNGLYANQKRKKRTGKVTEDNKKRLNIVHTCNIDFTNSDWAYELSKLFGTTEASTKSWVKNHMPKTYKKIIANQLVPHNRQQIVLNCNIDFSKRNWYIELSKLFNIGSFETYNWVKDNMKDFFNDKCYHDVFSGTDYDLIRIVSEYNNIDFSKRNWYIELSKLLNQTPFNSYEWMKKNMPVFFKDNCYQDEYSATKLDLVKIVNESDIDFTKENWEEELSKLINIKEKDAKKWLKTNLFNIEKDTSLIQFMNKRDIHSLESKVEARTNLILNSGIDFSNKNYIEDVAKLLCVSKPAAMSWLKKHMPELYNSENKKTNDSLTNNHFNNSNNVSNNTISMNSNSNIETPVEMLEKTHTDTYDKINALLEITYDANHRKRLEMIKYSGIDFSKRGWSNKLGTLLNLKPASAYAWIRNNYSNFYEKECYKTHSK